MRAGIVAVVAAAALGMLGCGATTTTGPTTQAACSVTLSGALTGTYNCQPATLVWASNGDNSGFAFTVAASGAQPGITVAIEWVGQPTTQTYSGTGSSAQAGITALTATNQLWAASIGGAGAAAGSYGLTLSRVTVEFTSSTSSGTTTAYTIAGTLDATLPAATASGATGTVTLHATF